MRNCICPAILLAVMMSGAIAGEPVFAPVKIDGPVHDPANASWWFGPFNESASVLDMDGDGDLDISCGKNWYEAPDWKKHENYFEGADKLPHVWDHCLEYALDVNKDGRTDVVHTGYDPGGIVWYENPGQPDVKWKAHKVYDSKVMEGAYPLGDIDGDGDMDLLGDNFSPRPNDGVTWFESIDEAPWFKRHLIGTQGGTHGSGLGDINGDGRPDIVLPAGWYEAPEKPAEDEKWVFHQYEPADPDGTERKGQTACPMAVTDVNSDGHNDIIMGRPHSHGLDWLEQVVDEKGDRRFRVRNIETGFSQFHTLTLADLNADGRLDLVTGKRLFPHNGNDPGAFEPLFMFWYDLKPSGIERHVLSFNHLPWVPGEQNFNPPPQAAIGTGMKILVRDIDIDGLVDIVVAGKSGLYVFYGRGESPVPAIKGKLPPRAKKFPEYPKVVLTEEKAIPATQPTEAASAK